MKKSSLIIFLLILAGSLCFCQEGEIVPLSLSTGTTLDALEREILGLFPEVDNFKNAQFYEIDIDHYYAKIASASRGHLRITREKYSWKEFQVLRNIVESHPEITQKVREDYLKRKSYHFVGEQLTGIQPKSYFTIKLHSGKKLRGFFQYYGDNIIHLKKLTGKEEISILDIDSIEYRPFRQKRTATFQTVYYSIVGLSGFGIAQTWTNRSNPAMDIGWHQRFKGVVFSLLLGSKFFDYALVLTTPKETIYVAQK